MPNARIAELCGLAKGVYERINERVLGCLDILKEWGMTGLLKGCMWECG